MDSFVVVSTRFVAKVIFLIVGLLIVIYLMAVHGSHDDQCAVASPTAASSAEADPCGAQPAAG